MSSLIIPPNKSFGRTFSVLSLILASYIYIEYERISISLLIISTVFLFFAQFYPRFLYPLNYVWTLFGFLMGKVTNPIMLTLIYIVMFIPLGFLLKLLGRDLLSLKFNKEASTYWIPKDNSRDIKDSMKVQF